MPWPGLEVLTQVVECLLSMSWVQFLTLQKQGMVLHTWNLSTGEAEAGIARVQGHPQ